MSSIVTKLAERLTALEALVSELKAENELLKMAVPLGAVTEGLNLASDEEKKAWVSAVQDVLAEHAEDSAPAKKKKAAASKADKPKRATTNASGPAEWNVFVTSVQQEMAATAGLDWDSFADDKSRKTALTKAGCGWQAALKEASIRKRMQEKSLDREEAEKQHAEEKTAAKEKREAKKAGDEPKKTAKKAAGSKKAAKKAEPEEEVSIEDQMASLGFEIKEIGGVQYALETSSGALFTIADGLPDEPAGEYDAEKDEIVASA
jgi:hypothetical protein